MQTIARFACSSAKQWLTRFLFLSAMSSFTTSAFAVLTFAPYQDFTMNTRWDNASSSMQPADLRQLSQHSGVKNFTLAFVVAPDGQTCKPTWGGMNEYAVAQQWGLNTIQQLRQQGGDVKISFGGASGVDLSVACHDTAQLKQVYANVMSTYQTHRLDFDVEGALIVDDLATTRMVKAISELQRQNPKLEITFTLPVLPSGLTNDGLRLLEKAFTAKIDVTHVNLMAMDYGDFALSRVDVMGDAAISAALATKQQLAQLQPGKSEAALMKQVMLTPMIGINDTWHYNVTPAQPERFTLTDAVKVKSFAEHNGMTEISMWSITRDHPCTNQWADPTCSGALISNGVSSKLQDADYTFSKTFLQAQ